MLQTSHFDCFCTFSWLSRPISMKCKGSFFRTLGLIIILQLICQFSFGQVHTFEAGLRVQKTVDLYYENGISGQYHLTKRITLGASYLSSRLGSAIGSNAIKQDNFLISGAWMFRPKKPLKPFLRANLGYFTADYESDTFKGLTNTSAMASMDAGLAYSFKSPVRLHLSLGYNAITGTGAKGAGTLYPVFYQTSIFWNLAKRKL
jgi:hypothetical protein